MSANTSIQNKRILVAVSKSREGEVKALFERDPLGGRWDPLFADGFSKARFILQHSPCDALLVHEDILDREPIQGLSWLCMRKDYPVVLIGQSPSNFQRAYEVGVQHCLPYDMALASAPLLSTILIQASAALDESIALTRTRDHLSHTRRHVDRLVTLMWRSSPQHGDSQWYSQPFLMERLGEELARAERYKVPLSLAIGELKPNENRDIELPEWTPDLLVRGKRRCDVVGQYGKSGFMVVMMHTPKSGGISCCKRLQNVLEQPDPIMAPTPSPSLRAYFGLSSMVGERSSVQSLLSSAEQNLEAARGEPTLRIVA
jgi:hypothetical protein